MNSYNILIYLPLGAIPSIAWLLFFIFQDKHKEKARNIIRIFLWGGVIALPVVFIEITTQQLFSIPLAAFVLYPFIYSFILVAFVEEFAKYFVVRIKALPYSFFNEPKDAIIYMITAALGFAAIENINYIYNFATNLNEVINIIVFRGITATFLHVIASGTLGYFLALSLINSKERKKFLYTGIIIATVLHGIYNNFIIQLREIIKKFGCGPESLCGESIFGMFIIASLLIIFGIIIVIALHKLAEDRVPTDGSDPP